MKKPKLLPGWILMLLGLVTLASSAQADLVYVGVEPCRIVDTRIAGGELSANTFRNFKVSGSQLELADQGGTADCPDPKAGTGQSPLAIVAYVIAVPTTGSGAGVLTAYPSDQLPPPPGTGSTVNFSAGQVIGNTTTITLCNPSGFCPVDGEFAILARSTNQHTVIDVQGYFYPEDAFANVETGIVQSWSNFGTTYGSCCSEVVTATCPTGSIMTGGGVRCNSDAFNSATTNFGVINASTPAGNSYLGACTSEGITYSTLKYGPAVTVYAVCAYSVPATSQATSNGVAIMQSGSADTGDQLQQGEPSEEALRMLQSLRRNAATLGEQH